LSKIFYNHFQKNPSLIPTNSVRISLKYEMPTFRCIQYTIIKLKLISMMELVVLKRRYFVLIWHYNEICGNWSFYFFENNWIVSYFSMKNSCKIFDSTIKGRSDLGNLLTRLRSFRKLHPHHHVYTTYHLWWLIYYYQTFPSSFEVRLITRKYRNCFTAHKYSMIRMSL